MMFFVPDSNAREILGQNRVELSYAAHLHYRMIRP